MRTLTVFATLALTLAACGEATDPDAAPVRESYRALISSTVAPGGEPVDFEVIVEHDPGVPPEALDEVVRRVRVEFGDVSQPEGTFDPRGVPPADVHWAPAFDHAIHVIVRPTLPSVAAQRLRWLFVDRHVADLFCPPGHGG